jgi:RNA recognition motif-containing protein
MSLFYFRMIFFFSYKYHIHLFQLLIKSPKSQSISQSTIYLPNPKVTDKEFKEFFSQYGTILDSIVMIDRDTKCSRGFGFVTFENPSIALDIIANNKSTRRENNNGKNNNNMNRSEVCINGKWCEVKASEPKRNTNASHNGHYYFYSRSVPHQQSGGAGSGGGNNNNKESSLAAGAGTGASATVTTGTVTTLEDVEDGGAQVPPEVVHYNHYYMMNYPNPYMYHPYSHHHAPVPTPTPPSNPYVTGYVPTQQPSSLPHPSYAPSMGGYYYLPHPSSYPTPAGPPPPQQYPQYPQPLQGEWMYNNDYHHHYNNMMYNDGGISHEGGVPNDNDGGDVTNDK